MGSERFQSEYIEYLQNRNDELLSKLAQMKEIYENKIFSKDINQHYFISTLVDVLNVCTAVPEEIDTLFDKMSETMSVLINILSRKSALIQLGEKVSKLLNSPHGGELIDVHGAEENNNSKTNKRAGTVKVSPMINGHIISTEPRIYLSRVSRNYIPPRTETQRLSPILEASPDLTSDSSKVKNHDFKELRVISERLNLNQATYNYINQESPKGRFKGTKIWKKSLSSNSQTLNKKDVQPLQNNENEEKLDAGETGQPELTEHDTDPMEGPSWLYNNQQGPKSSPKCFINFRRRRHRYARVFDKDEDDTCFKKEDSKADSTHENKPSNESFNKSDNANNLKNLNGDRSRSLIGSDDEYTPRSRKRKSLRRRERDSKKNFDGDTRTPSRRSPRFSNKGKNDSDTSDSSYEGDNEENSPGKCKSARKSCINNNDNWPKPFESELRKTQPRETLRESEKEAHVLVEDCMKGKKNSKKEKFNRVKSNGSRSNSKTKSPALNFSGEKKTAEISNDGNLTNQNQRSRRKAAPTNLTEPKLCTKLRRS